MNAHPETQAKKRAENPEVNQVPPDVRANQEATQRAAENTLDNSGMPADNKESSKNKEANPNPMNANPEVNPEAQAGLDRETKLKAIFAKLEEAMQNSNTEQIDILREELVRLGIPESELPSAKDGQEAIEMGLKIINLVRKLLHLNPENLEDWDTALKMVKEETALVGKAFRLHAVALQTVAEKTMGLEAVTKEWASKSEADQVAYLRSQIEGFNRLGEIAENMPFNKAPFLALRGMKRSLGAVQTLVSDRSLATIPTVDLVDLILTGVLPTSEAVISQLEAMLNPVDLDAAANVAEKVAPVVSIAGGPNAGFGMEVAAKLLKIKNFTNRGHLEACRALRAERRAVANVQSAEEAAAMQTIKEAANNNENYRNAA